MTYDEFLNFLDEFEEIKSFAGKINAANQNLQRIGSGSGRAVYDIDGTKVLKVAKNQKGVAQNEVEASIGHHDANEDILAKVFESANDDTWLVAEKAKKVGEKRIKELTGIPSLHDLHMYLRNFDERNRGGRGIFGLDQNIQNQLDENEFVSELTYFAVNYSQHTGDWGRPSSYGEVLRDGQPTIVLTDYGLNDEVYSTYYDWRRKQKQQQYRMYELFNAGDGNDDILSDIGNTGEVRLGMWGLMPYGVNDNATNEGVINEDFISFVLNRDKYPTRPLPSAPYLIDAFHECVNNLSETLKHVENKSKFYNNLLALQEYLIEQKYYDREPLTKEEYSISEVSVPSVKQGDAGNPEYGQKLISMFAEKMNMPTPQYLGSGSNGHAFLSGNVVLKITSNLSEAESAFKIIKHGPPRYLADVYKVYKIVDSENNLSFFVTVQEFIANRPKAKFDRYDNLLDIILPEGLDAFQLKKKIRRQFNYAELMRIAEKILEEHPDADISTEDRRATYEYFAGLINIQQELINFGIKSDDWTNTENLGYKNGLIKFFDVGGLFGKFEPEVPEQDVVLLPENMDLFQDVDFLNEEEYNRKFADILANKVAELRGYGKPQFIGSGHFGVAYDIGDDKVLKITSDKAEATDNLKLIDKPLRYIAQPYEVFSITSKSLSGIPETYGIVLEKLKTDTAIERLHDRLDFVFKSILRIDLSDVLEHYLGMWHNEDVDEQKVNAYLKKNPRDEEFFYGLLKIAEELQKYGIESVDFMQPLNLGYKKSGALGFFDVGFGNYKTEPQGVERVEVAEDGSSKFSTDTAIGQDEFPTYNQNDTSPLTDNNVPPIDEDLEYNYVVGDATEDEYMMTERKLSYMPNAKAVTVKKKCRLGGLGNISAACNQGDISNLEFKNINEEIDASEAYEDRGTIQTMLDGRKDVGLLAFNYNPHLVSIIDKENFGRIPVEQIGNNVGMHIIHRNTPRGKTNAERLYQIMKSHGGYVADKTPEEAREIGKLLDYSDESINKYINRLYYRLPDGQIGRRNTEQLYQYDREHQLTLAESNSIADDDALNMVIKGKRDISIVKLRPENVRQVEKNGLKVLPLRMEAKNVIVSIVYRNNTEKAHALRRMAMERGGYLLPKTPEEAREIFKMLEYSDKAIEKFITKKFGDLKETQYPSIETHELTKTFIRKEDDADVYAVNGSSVKENGFIEFVEGGHYYVDAKDPESEQKYAKFIPENEIWIDEVFQSKPIDMEAIILHEKLERHLMKNYGYSYDRAHDVCNFAETIFRQKAKEGSERNIANAIYNVFIKKFSNPNLSVNEVVKKKSNKTYYRAVENNAGNTVEFEPQGFYEAIDDEGNPVIKYDTHWVSDTPETAASYSVGGAVLGLYSMFRQHGKVPNIFYIYGINEEPDVDISHWDMGDFSLLQEVRYRRPVRGKYVGKVTITDELKEKLNAYYEMISGDEYDTPIYDPEYERQMKIAQNIDYDKLLSGVKNMVHENLVQEAQLMSLQELPFKDDVLQHGGNIYSVGGAVRDEFLGKESKDLDVLVTGIPMDELEQILSKYGRVDAVGKSFGVLKFRPQGGEEIDVAIPRTEKPTGDAGHKAFDVTSDHALPIEKDLERRDFTINAIAKDIDGNIVDPFGGKNDLKRKIIRVVNPEAFSDDPLRMLRAVQFAARFGFTIEPKTMKMIQDNANRIKEIPAERILTEFDKIVKKGDMLTGADLLDETGLLSEIFGKSPYYSFRNTMLPFNKAKTMGEFIYLLTSGVLQNPAEFYKNNLRGDIDTYKEIKALQLAYDHAESTSLVEARSIAHNMYIISPISLQSRILPTIIETAANELLQGKYPKTSGELAINGNDLMFLGLEGKEIGDMQKTLLLKVYSDKLRNTKRDLTTYVNDTQLLNEDNNQQYVEKLKKELRDTDDWFYNNNYSSPQWKGKFGELDKERERVENHAKELRLKLFDLTGDYYGETKADKEKKKIKPEGLNAEYDSPYDVPIDVYRYILNNTSLLNTDASDAVRWSRIINTKNDTRYPKGAITIYRAVEKPYNEIREGDWVTTDENYAIEHNNRYLDGNGNVVSMEVDGRDVLVSPTGNAEEAIYAPLEDSIDVEI